MLSHPLFFDRIDAGNKLAKVVLAEISKLTTPFSPIVYALPRGGLPVALPLAKQLGCPLDIIIAKKITNPYNTELALGAITTDDCLLWSSNKPRHLLHQKAAIFQAKIQAQKQLANFANRPSVVIPENPLVILIDDGIATGATMAVAAKSLRMKNLAQLWVCSPVGPVESRDFFGEWVDRVIILETPEPFLSVGRFYQNFPQVETANALKCLQQQTAWLTNN